ncbi:MAG: hypothetical protein GX786_07390, partial [Clostridiales bacterium]|nr:hypothetical protein [Clostridiales bacterium]
MTFLRIFYILLVLAVVFFERKNPSEALMWLVLMLLLPGVGVLLYLIFGSTIGIKITGFSRSKKLKNYADTAFNTALINSEDPHFLSLLELSSMDRSVIRFNIAYNKSPLVFCDDADIYISGSEHYQALFADIENAEKQILVEFYTIHNDQVGHKLVAALAKKAKEGVDVKVLMDFIANISSTPSMFKPLKEAGGQVI